MRPMRRSIFVLALASMSLSTFAATPTKSPVLKLREGQSKTFQRNPSGSEKLRTDELLAGARCSDIVSQALDKWGSLGQWRMSNIDMDGAHIYRGRTSWSGVWLEVRRYANDEVTAFRMTSNTLTSASWRRANCTPSIRVDTSTQQKSFLYGSFNDANLDAMLKREKTGIIYIWSPHMKYSLRGMREILKIAKALKVHVEVLVEGAASDAALRDVQNTEKIDPKYMRAVDSLDIVMRHTTLHYPSMLLFKDGEVLDFMLPGYEASRPLTEIISSRLGL